MTVIINDDPSQQIISFAIDRLIEVEKLTGVDHAELRPDLAKLFTEKR